MSETTGARAVFRQAGRGDLNKAAQIILAREQGDLELIDRKTFNYLLNRAYGQLQRGRDEINRVPVADVLDYLGHSSTDRLHESLSRLGSVNILIDYVDDTGVHHSSQARYLSYDVARAPDGWVEFAFDALLLRFLHNPKVFATLSLSAVRRFKSAYAARLYEIMALQLNKRFPYWETTIDSFREVMAVGSGYNRYDNLRRRVIAMAVDEVNEVAPFSVDVEDVRSGKGGRVVALRFSAMPKGPRTLRGLTEASAPARRGGPGWRDPDTIDLLQGTTDAERDPLGVSAETMRAAAEAVGDTGSLDAHLEEWRERMRGRRVPKPDQAFMTWLEIRLAKLAGAELKVLDDDTISALVEQWEGAR